MNISWKLDAWRVMCPIFKEPTDGRNGRCL